MQLKDVLEKNNIIELPKKKALVEPKEKALLVEPSMEEFPLLPGPKVDVFKIAEDVLNLIKFFPIDIRLIKEALENLKIKKFNVDDKAVIVIVHHEGPQKLYVVDKDGKIISSYDISTSKKGIDNRENSNGTPLGVHKIWKKVEKLPNKEMLNKKEVFIIESIHKSSKGSKVEIDKTDGKDYMTTAILGLEGLEERVNKGKDTEGNNVDSKKRGIHIHGTNEEYLIGSPASMGCIRMKNDDIMKLCKEVDVGTFVFILYQYEKKTYGFEQNDHKELREK